MAEWIFTFGPDHKHPETGESFAGRYVRLDADDEMAARVRMFALFGRAWSSVYPLDRGIELANEYGWSPLFVPHQIFPSVQEYHLDDAMRMLDDMTRDDLPAEIRDALRFVLSRDRAMVEKERIAARDAFLRLLPPLQDQRVEPEIGYWHQKPAFGALPPVKEPDHRMGDDVLPLIGDRVLDYTKTELGVNPALFELWPDSPPLYTGNVPPELPYDEEAASELAEDWAEADEQERRDADAENGPEYDEGDRESDDPREMTELDNGDHD